MTYDGRKPEPPYPTESDFDQVMEQRDRYHEVADELTEAIAEYFGQDFGEHSSANDPWANALNFLRNL